MPARFSPRQIGSLARLIQPNFTIATLKSAVQFGLGTTLETYSTAPTLPALILELCNKVNAQDAIDGLINGLKDANPINQPLHSALDTFMSRQAATGDICGLLVLRPLPRLTMVNRQTLRSHLEQMTLPGSGFRVLSVTGPQACGKSHSRELIRLLAEHLGYHYVQIDVAEETRVRSQVEVLEKITLNMRQPYSALTGLLLDNPSDARAAERFVDWIAGLSQNFSPGEQFWLTFDGLDRSGAEPVRDNLVPALMKAVRDDALRSVRLFLLGDNGKRVRPARTVVLHEQVTNLARAELEAFFVAYAAQAGFALEAADRDGLVDHVVGNARWPLDHQALEDFAERMQEALAQIDGLTDDGAGNGG
jgi:hypothetical protein